VTYLKEDVLVNLFGIDILFLPTLMMPMPMLMPMPMPMLMLPILLMTVLVHRVLLVPMQMMTKTLTKTMMPLLA